MRGQVGPEGAELMNYKLMIQQLLAQRARLIKKMQRVDSEIATLKVLMAQDREPSK